MPFSPAIHTDVVKRDRLGSEYFVNAHTHIGEIRAALDLIPEQFRKDAVFSIHTWLDRDGVEEHSMTVSYDRPPTEAEIAQQVEENQKRVAEDLEWLVERAGTILVRASECGYVVPEEQWPLKADQPASHLSLPNRD